ncbi:hypothetical protein, partial [Hydrococcus rivularis]|uniref:hypothetical protein n=1 Tax=Hydrococcus rivularis TaxID=1616834 RepID=UPI001C31CB3C
SNNYSLSVSFCTVATKTPSINYHRGDRGISRAVALSSIRSFADRFEYFITYSSDSLPPVWQQGEPYTI